MNVHSLSRSCLLLGRLDENGARWPAAEVPKRAPVKPPWDTRVLGEFPPSKRYLIGVSGGRDSVALLHWLVQLGYRKLVVCHLDHRLRGGSSTADARFVQRLAHAHGLSFELGRRDVRQLAAETKQSIETAARTARYQFFAEVGRRRRCPRIFLGHHADDLVETFLINLFRGAGTLGLRSIQPVTSRRIDDVDMMLIRPLLVVSRGEIADYVKTHRLRFREDATNASSESLRNRVRHQIIPALEKEFGRDIRKTVRRAAVIAADEEELLSALVPPVSRRLKLAEMRALPLAMQRRMLARWLRMHEVVAVGFDMVETVRSLLDVAAPAKVNLTRDRHAHRRAGELFLE